MIFKITNAIEYYFLYVVLKFKYNVLFTNHVDMNGRLIFTIRKITIKQL